MNKNLQVALFVLIVLVGAVALYYSFWSKPPTLTEEEKTQDLIESIRPTTTTTSLSPQELKKISDSIAPRDQAKIINN